MQGFVQGMGKSRDDQWSYTVGTLRDFRDLSKAGASAGITTGATPLGPSQG